MATRTNQTKPKTKSSQASSKKKKSYPVALSQTSEELLADFNENERQAEILMGEWAKRLKITKAKLNELNRQYIDIIIKLLKEAYSVYREVNNHDLSETFFGALRSQLFKEGVGIQANTPNASLIVRFICGSGISAKSASQYSRVIMAAEYNNILEDEFYDWVKNKTMTKIVNDYRAIESKSETYAERMDRARRVIMRLIEARETKPILSGVTNFWAAENQLSREGLWIGIGNATRKMDRESFYADINMAMFLPPNIDIEIYIINSLAKEIVGSVERYEEGIAKLEESVWADELWNQLVSVGFEESDKSNKKWRNKQQAATGSKKKSAVTKKAEENTTAKRKKTN